MLVLQYSEHATEQALLNVSMDRSSFNVTASAIIFLSVFHWQLASYISQKIVLTQQFHSILNGSSSPLELIKHDY